jgi:hypothetical protein
MSKETQRLLLMLVIGVCAGVAVVMLMKDDTNSEGAKDSSTAQGETVQLTDNSVKPATEYVQSMLPAAPEIPKNVREGLTVKDQQASRQVSATGFSVRGTAWIAIYDDQAGRPGWILGAARVHDGDTSITVDLLRPEGTTAGATYYAALLSDDGDDEFNRLTDLPPLSPDKVVIVSFMAN